MHDSYNYTSQKNILTPDEQVKAWICRAKDGDGESLGHLIAACQGYLMSIARQCVPQSLNSKVDPADLLQETALDVHRGFACFKGDSLQELCSWMRRILLNNYSGIQRRFHGTIRRDIHRELVDGRNHSSPDELADSRPTPSQLAIGLELRVQIFEAIDRLPDDMKAAILLRHREQLTFAEIGDRLGRSSDAARKLWGRAIERLERDIRCDSL